jgi:hypothetical protein
MNTQSKSKLLVYGGLIALAITLAMGTSQSLSAESGGKMMMMDGKMTERCQEMMSQRHKLHEEMKAQDAELSEEAAAMNSAPEDKKLSLMAALVTHMVEQRSAMNMRMERMHGDMMTHMMQHMEMGKESLSQCPMMKGMRGMKGMDDKGADEHKHHHEETK